MNDCTPRDTLAFEMSMECKREGTCKTKKQKEKGLQTRGHLLWGIAARMRLAPTSDIAVLERDREMREVLRSRADGKTNVNI